MSQQSGLFDLQDRYGDLSRSGDPLERLTSVVDFELFRPALTTAMPRQDRSKGGRPPMDLVMMFKFLVQQALYGLSDEQAEYPVRDRLSFMRCPGMTLADRVPARCWIAQRSGCSAKA